MWLAALFTAGYGHASEYLIETWDTSSGLPQNTVRAINQTADGYLWIGTENGVARFDGVKFENFERENMPALQNPNVESLVVDGRSGLWIGTAGHTARWTGRSLVDAEWPLASGDSMSQCLLSTSNEMYFSTLQGCLIRGRPSSTMQWQWTSTRPVGLSVFTTDNRRQIWRLVPGGGLWRMSDMRINPVRLSPDPGKINVLVTNPAGRLWIGTEHQLFRQEGAQLIPVSFPAGVADFNVTELFPLRDGTLWVMANERLWKFKDDQWTMTAEPWTNRPSQLVKLIEDRNGNAWFSHFGKGLIRLEKNGKLSTLTTRDGLPGDRVRCMFEDREGNLWVGIDRGGLARLRQKQFRVLGSSEGLSDPVTLGICEDAAGAIWVGTYGGGLNRWNGNTFERYDVGSSELKGYVYTVYPDRKGRLWIGTRSEGVFTRENGVISNRIPNTVIPYPTRAIFEDHAGTIWLGTSGGVFCWREGQIEHFAQENELDRADIRAFAEDAENAIWIGSHGSGLHRFLRGEHLALTTADGLPNEFIRTLFAEKNGTVWIGLYGGGLFRWKAGHLSRAAPARDLPDDVICHIEDDGQERLWISTHHGLFRVAKTDLQAFAEGVQNHVPSIVYGKSDGLPSVDFSGGVQPSGWRARDGRLWFTTGKGIVSLQPAEVTLNPLPPSVVVESVLVNGSLFASSTENSPSVADVNSSLRIPAGRTQFEFSFTGLSFTAPDKVRFQYRLDGLEKEWLDAGVNRSVVYNYLPPGRYEFRVRAANNDGVWSEGDARVSFELLPHFWQRWWFPLLLIAAAFAIAWMIYYFRIGRLRDLERLRLRIARDLHDDVGANLASVALIAEAMEKHAAFGDPADLRRIALHTIDSLRDIVWFIDPARDNLGDLISRMRDTVPTLLGGLKLDFQIHAPNPAINLPPAFRRNVFPIFKEALHNTSRHAGASSVKIELDCSNGGLKLKISDNGRGFDEHSVIPGNGLRNLRRRTGEMNGTVAIVSSPGQGTTIDFFAPFPQTRGLGFISQKLYSRLSARNLVIRNHESGDQR